MLKYKINFYDLINKFNNVGDTIYTDEKPVLFKMDIKNSLEGIILNKQFSFDKEKDNFILRLHDNEFILSKEEMYNSYFNKKVYQKCFEKNKLYQILWYLKTNLLSYGLSKYELSKYFKYFRFNEVKLIDCILIYQRVGINYYEYHKIYIRSDMNDIIEKYRTYIMYNYFYKKLINLFNKRLDRYVTDNIFEFILGISLLKNN